MAFAPLVPGFVDDFVLLEPDEGVFDVGLFAALESGEVVEFVLDDVEPALEAPPSDESLGGEVLLVVPVGVGPPPLDELPPEEPPAAAPPEAAPPPLVAPHCELPFCTVTSPLKLGWPLASLTTRVKAVPAEMLTCGQVSVPSVEPF